MKLKPTHFNPRKPVQIMDDCYYSPEAEVSDGGFIANVPEGFYRALRWSKGFDLPIIVTENGINDSTDRLRPRYLVEHLHQLWKAVNFSFPIKGYFHWSLVDNFEWERGWGQRFGLWELDLQTQSETQTTQRRSVCRNLQDERNLLGDSGTLHARADGKALPRLRLKVL